MIFILPSYYIRITLILANARGLEYKCEGISIGGDVLPESLRLETTGLQKAKMNIDVSSR